MKRGWLVVVLLVLVSGCGRQKDEKPGPWIRQMIARSLMNGQTLYEGKVDYKTFDWVFGNASWRDQEGNRHEAIWQSDQVGIEFHPPESQIDLAGR